MYMQINNAHIREYYERPEYNIIPPPLPENKSTGYSSIPRVWLSAYPDKDGVNGKPFMFCDEINGQHYNFIIPYNKVWSLCISDERILKKRTLRRAIFNVWKNPKVFEAQEYFLIKKECLLKAYIAYKKAEDKKKAESMQLSLF